MAARSAGLLALSHQVSVAAQVQSFDDCFYIAAIVAALGILPALWLKRGKSHHPPPAGMLAD